MPPAYEMTMITPSKASPPASFSASPSTKARTDPASSQNSTPELPSESQNSAVAGTDLGEPSLEADHNPKGRRKRTAAKDKSILEAAYQADPKPDKTARLEIVKRVSLNEKEVQIWFQNRRQNDRRKTRPLSPQEIAALRYGAMQVLSPDPLGPISGLGTVDAPDIPDTSSRRAALGSERTTTSPLQSDTVSSCKGAQNVAKPPLPSSAERKTATSGDRAGLRSSWDVAKNTGAGTPEEAVSLSRSFPSSVGYLSSRWNRRSSFSLPSTSTLDCRGESSFRRDSLTTSTGSVSASAKGPILPAPHASSSSHFRLSLSLHGKAEIVTSLPSPTSAPTSCPIADGLTPLKAIRAANFSYQPSYGINLPPIASLLSSGSSGLPPRLTRGRSRDVHAWEFACDAENAEDALTVQANHESSGSAAAAISLLRSTSGCGSNNALQPSKSAKRNAAASRAAPRGATSKRPRLDFGRASSSFGRRETELGPHEKRTRAEHMADPDGGKVKVSMLLSPSANDSDKENWSPDEDGMPQHSSRAQPDWQQPGLPPLRYTAACPQSSRPDPYAQPRHGGRGVSRSLQNSDRLSTAPAISRHYKQAPLSVYEDPDDEGGGRVPDDEVQRFLLEDLSPGKDVDAVAGLLSLSQGNWR